MKINGKLSILIDENGLTVEVKDADSAITFLRGKLSPKETLQALGRLMSVEMEKCNVVGLDKIGKKLEIDNFEFKNPCRRYENDNELLYQTALNACPAGWVPDNYFNSQNTHFIKDDKDYVRVTIRRWV